jgi:RNA polymerase sigma-70 factor (ECF subfamily)
MTTATIETTAHARLDAAADEDLLARMADGDRDALGELYRRHRGVVRGFVLGRIARGDDADDVVQETFLRAGKEAGDYRAEDGHPVPQWLCYLAGGKLIDYGRHEVHPYLAAARGAREQARRPVTESAEARESTPLSEPVQAALARLTPGERRAIQLRYIDGLGPDQAAEIVGVRKRSFHRRVAHGRQKLAEELADLAPQSRSPLQDVPRREAIKRALAAAGDDVPAAAAWLHRHGIRVSESNLYRYRQMLHAGDPLPGERATPRRSMRPAYPVYTPPEHVAAVASALERARAVGVDYRTRFGHLPTRREVMDAVGVSESTATRALRPLKAQPDARQVGSVEADESRIDTRPAAGNDRTGITRGEPTPAADQEPTGRHRPRGAHLNDVRQPHAEGGVAAERSTDRHPVQVTGQATRSARQGHESGRARPNQIADVDTYYATTAQADERHHHREREHDRDTAPARSRPAGERLTDQASQRAGHTADDAADRPPPAQVSIDRARAAVAVLVAHRAVQAQRRQVEHDRAERAARWNADDQHRAHADARSDAEGMCLQ